MVSAASSSSQLSKYHPRYAQCAARVIALTLVICPVAVPTASAAPWIVRQVGPSVEETGGEANFYGISCATETRCVAVGDRNIVGSSTDPTGGPGAWKVIQPVEDVPCEDQPRECDLPPTFLFTHRKVRDISCPTAVFCAAVNFQGFIYSTTNPTGDAADWKVVDVDGEGRDAHLESISCPDPAFCVAVSGNRYTAGKILSSSNPNGGRAAWNEVDLGEAFDLRDVSCPSRSFCMAVGSDGRVVSSINPSGPASAWKDLGTPGGPGNLEGISCVLSELCLTGNSAGNLLSTQNPFSVPPIWAEVHGGGSVQITDVSCPMPSRCAVVDNNGDVLISTNPTTDPSAWSFTNLIDYVPPDEATHTRTPNAIFGVSCPSASFCALAATERRIFTSADPFAAPPEGGPTGPLRRKPKRPRTTLAHVDRFNSYTRRRNFKATFRFFADGKVRKFICKHDGDPWRSCKSPNRYWVSLGLHVFRVRAIGLSGLKGPIALERFRVLQRVGAHVH